MSEKVILTNRKALIRKYGSPGLTAIRNELSRMIAADKSKGVTTRIIFVDNRSQMRKVGGRHVDDPTDPEQNKAAVDAVYGASVPDYIMLLGAPDVVPHQDLRNPVYQPGADDDRYAFGDLPYACNGQYSQTISRFLNPVRVVGRLPDLCGGSDPSYLISVLKAAARWESRDRQKCEKYLGVSAKVWKASTKLSLRNTFGSASDLKTSPPEGPGWGDLVKRRSHFINCHGAQSDPNFYGENRNTYPVAHQASYLVSRVASGTVVAAECCYGAELYEVDGITVDHPGICNTYMRYGAYAFLGSSTIAYGPAAGNGAADLICQYFLQGILRGASTGRAALEARLEFVQNETMLDPIDLKTVAQFSLMGDPSIHPVMAERALVDLTVKKQGALFGEGRSIRRQRVFAKAEGIKRTVGYASGLVYNRSVQRRIGSTLRNLAKNAGIEEGQLSTFRLRPGTGPSYDLSAKKVAGKKDGYYHLVTGTTQGGGGKYIRVVVAREEEGKLTVVRVLHGHGTRLDRRAS